jgi:exodeoxyribonuclease VII small subunit
MSTENPTTPPFEIALQNLEDLVEQIESGDLALEDALAAFEKGVSLVKYCNQKLSEIEQKIELLVRDKEGKLQLTALNASNADPNDDQ